MELQIEPLFENIKFPEYATDGSAGMDLIAHNFKKFYTGSYALSNPNTPEVWTEDTHAILLAVKTVIMQPQSRLLVGCGYKVAIPKGYEIQVRPRSGLALKEGITVINSPGTVDSDYRGELMVTLINTSKFAVEISLGERIAQMVVNKYEVVTQITARKLDETKRGEGGLGSTGK